MDPLLHISSYIRVSSLLEHIINALLLPLGFKLAITPYIGVGFCTVWLYFFIMGDHLCFFVLAIVVNTAEDQKKNH